MTDRQNGLQVFDSDMHFVAKWADCGDDRRVGGATGVALNSQGNIYVNDLFNGRICKYDGSGAFQTALSGFSGPVGLITVDNKQGDIYGTEPFPTTSYSGSISREEHCGGDRPPGHKNGPEGRFRAEDMVGAAGFEPTTTSPPDWCATRLRHAPTGVEV